MKSLLELPALNVPRNCGLILFALIIFSSSMPAQAQFFERLSNPSIVVNLKHPPKFGFKVSKVAFGQASGNCADQIVDAVQSDFVANQVEVIEREHLNNMLAEHHFTLSGYVDQSTAVAMGKFLGPTTLIFVKIHQCNTTQDRLYDNEVQYDSKTKTKYSVVAYYSRTRAYLKGSIEAVDLSTGRIIGKQELEYSPEKKNKSYQGYPEYPADFDLSQNAMHSMIDDVHKMFLSWPEQREVIFYDDNKGGLKQAFQALKSGDIDQAFELSKQNVEAAKNMPKANDKLQERAYYNLGMCYMIRDDYNNALVNFRTASGIKSGEIVTTAIAECQKAIALYATMKQIDQKAILEAEKKQSDNDNAAQKEVSNTLTNNDVVKLARMKLSEAIIIQKIKLSKCNFDTSADALGLLTKSGVSEKVVMAMMEKSQ
jgi:tetratricopeptide (TPR) repeat protein